jgi:hypothetical protein
MPDSGFFLDYQGIPSLGAGSHGVNDIGPGVYRTDMQWVFYSMNASSGASMPCAFVNVALGCRSYDVESKVCVSATGRCASRVYRSVS